jgi:polyisoprenoid-binding protein YceI
VKHPSFIATAAALATVILFTSVSAAPVTYDIDPSHSYVGFQIRHLMSKVTGQFGEYAGTLTYDAENPAASKVEATIQAASIDTNNEKRDGHLKSDDFFDVEKFPSITFVSKSVAVDGKKLTLTGDLTMHGSVDEAGKVQPITKPVTLNGEVTGMIGEPGKRRAGFSVTGTVNRKDFGITWNKTLDQDNTLLGDDVAIMIDVEAVEKAPAAAEAAQGGTTKTEATNK